MTFSRRNHNLRKEAIAVTIPSRSRVLDFIKSSVSSDPSRLVVRNDQRLSRKYSDDLWCWSERDLVLKTLQATDKGLGKAWCAKPLASVALLQLRILNFGLFQDRDVRVGVFPELKKFQVGMAGLRLISCQDVGAGKLQLCQGSQR